MPKHAKGAFTDEIVLLTLIMTRKNTYNIFIKDFNIYPS
jgi:hypothetical protein